MHTEHHDDGATFVDVVLLDLLDILMILVLAFRTIAANCFLICSLLPAFHT